MSLSAVSLGLTLLLGSDSQQLTAEETKIWKKIEPSIVYVLRGGQPVGSAALIDDRGYFLLHRSLVTGGRLEGRLASGEVVQLVFKATDEPTQLSLVIADNWVARNSKPVDLATEDPKGKLFAILPTGPIRAEYRAGSRIGMLTPSKRAMTLNEIGFEAPPQNVGGALVFTQNGELLGALNGTLEGTQVQKIAISDSAMETMRGGTRHKFSNQQMGPGGLTVAYTVGPEALRRVVDGFRSPTHEVFHPALGIMCVDTPANEGALIDSVRMDSQAALAGVKKGDIIVEMAGLQVTSKVDYARILLRQNVGARITLKVKRGSLLMYVPLTVGK